VFANLVRTPHRKISEKNDTVTEESKTPKWTADQNQISLKRKSYYDVCFWRVLCGESYCKSFYAESNVSFLAREWARLYGT